MDIKIKNFCANGTEPQVPSYTHVAVSICLRSFDLLAHKSRIARCPSGLQLRSPTIRDIANFLLPQASARLSAIEDLGKFLLRVPSAMAPLYQCIGASP